jgi:aldehyde dehydrogenase
MPAITEKMVREVVAQVMGELNGAAPSSGAQPTAPSGPVKSSPWLRGPNGQPRATNQGGDGVFQSVDDAVNAAAAAQQRLEDLGMQGRRDVIRILRDLSLSNLKDLGQREFDETKIGRLDHKYLKLEVVAEHTPGVESLETEASSGDNGLAITEHAPWGVIGIITPVTHSVPTLLSNAIQIVAAGNSLVCNPHPSGANVAAYAARLWNEEIRSRTGIESLISVIETPTLETAEQIFSHRQIAMLCITGGPGVARAAMKARKKAVVAGPGNPPVVVDETADLDSAAHHIVGGCAFDNNLLCTAEKEVFAVASIFEPLMSAIERHGGLRLSARQIDELTRKAFPTGQGGPTLDKSFVGQSPQFLGQQIGLTVPDDVQILFGQTEESSPFVDHEQMMPFLPFVSLPDANTAIEKARHYEHGYRHTAMIHSRDVSRITQMARTMNTTILVANGSSMCVAEPLGHAHLSYSIATPTGEGVTSPLTFTRKRRTVVLGSLRTI